MHGERYERNSPVYALLLMVNLISDSPEVPNRMPEQNMISIVVAEELTFVREGIAELCEKPGQHRVVAQCPDGVETLEAIDRLKPELAVVDFQIPKLHSLELMRKVRESQARTRFIVMANRGDRKVAVEVLRAGAQGFVLKSAHVSQFFNALQQVAAGSMYISPEIEFEKVFFSKVVQKTDAIDSLSSREYQVFRHLVDGVPAKEIAARLEISPKTIDTYRAGLMRKLDIHNVAGLMKFAVQRDLIAL
jgi:DNA-binding NarL/FixJ family response regulator